MITKQGELKGTGFSKKSVVVIALLIGILLLVGGMYLGKTKNVEKDKWIQGTLQMTEIDLNSKIPGTIDKILVEEGQEVKAGDVIAILTSDTIKAKLKQAESAKMAAEAKASMADEGARKQQVVQAKAKFDFMTTTLERVKKLVEAGALPQDKLDEVNLKYIASKEDYEMALEGARVQEKDGAEALVLKAEGAVAEVNSYLEDSQIKAPIDGIVSIINVNQGELISQGMPLASVLSKKEPWVEVNVEETKLSMVHLGEEVKLKMPAFPDKIFKGKIVTVNEKPDFATKRATNDNGDFDILSYGVKIKLLDVKEELYKGMTVIVDFNAEV